MKTQTIQTSVNLRLNVFTVAAICVVAIAFSTALPAQETSTPPKHHHYRAEIIPPDGGSDSFGAGYLFYIPLTDRGTYGASGDTATPGVNNSFIWTNGKQVTLEPLPQLPNLTGTNTFINWINQSRFTSGFGTRTDSITGVSLDQAAIWAPNGQIFPSCPCSALSLLTQPQQHGRALSTSLRNRRFDYADPFHHTSWLD